MPYAQSLNLVMILNGIGFPARILPGYIADAHLGALNTFSICVFLTTITLFCWLAVTSIPAYYAFISFYGLFAAAFQSLFATTVASLSQDNLSMAGTRLGMAFSVIGMSALVSGPISGALLKAGGGYTGVICWAAVSTVVGLGLCVWARGWKAGWHWGTKC
jgi:MFS family permease